MPFEEKVNIVQHKEDNEEDDICCKADEVDEYEEEDGQIFVVWRMMLVPKQEDQTQCHQLFRNQYTIEGKTFGVIVDSGNYENIIRKETTKKLSLLIE